MQCDNTDVEIGSLTSEELDTLVQWTTSERWNTTMADEAAMFNAYPEGFFAARINGKPVGCISGVRMGEDLGSVGTFIVDEQFRGQGIGRCLWKHVDQYLGLRDGRRNTLLSARFAMVDTYRKYGFKVTSWDMVNYIGVPTLDNLKCEIDKNIKIIPVDESLMTDILNYDRSISMTSRETLIRNVFKKPESVSLVAIEGSRVLGYGTLAPAIEGLRFAPLYADSAAIARGLIKALLEATPKEIDSLVFDGVSTNSHMESIATDLSLKEGFRLTRMYTVHELNIDTDKVYGLCNTDTCVV